MNRSPWRLEEVDGSPWRLEEVDGGDEQYPVESCFAVRHSPPDEHDPRFDRSAPTQVRFVRFAVRHTPSDQQDPRFDRMRFVSSVLQYARPLPMNRIPFRPWPVEHKAVSFVLRYPRPRFHRLFRPSRLASNEHDDAFHSDPVGWLNMNTTTMFLRSDPAMYTSPGHTYARVGGRDPARMYTYMAIFSFLHTGRCTYVYMLRARLYYETCAPLLRHVCASTLTSIYVRTHSRPE